MPLVEYKLIADLPDAGWPAISESLISINCDCLSIGQPVCFVELIACWQGVATHVNEGAASRTKPMRPPNLDIMAGNAAVVGNFIGG
jgi:hypothetical protein